MATPPRELALLVEPSPFPQTSGYYSRFKNLLMQLRESNGEVLVIVIGIINKGTFKRTFGQIFE